ncbi:MAG: mechanosensitive ion channel [Sphingomonadales bacterium]|nr:mechanosensitive ion channel [Sphingomonadales bacterium]MBD3774969.1 mechanosensitive ion channel [Paracoccaceae bacterium]
MGRLVIFCALLALSSLSLATPSLALTPFTSPAAETSSAASPQPAIDAVNAAPDERIQERIRGIFGELPAFSRVEVQVSEGVVTLSGTVPGSADAKRAEAIASRVSGVVTVENRIERDVSIAAGSGALARVAQRWDSLVKLLPLVALAVAIGLAIASVGYLLGRLGTLWERIAPNSFMAELFAGLVRFSFAILGLVVALDMLGATALLGAVLGGAGVIGIALGFAMRDTIENYVASLLLSLRQPFRARDWVCIDDHEGHVIRLTSRATILMTLDGNQLRIPNAQVFNATILNFTANPQRRFDFELGIDAEDDPTDARHLGVEVLAGLPFVLADPPPSARVEQVGDSNIVIRFLGWIDQRETDWYKARSRAIPAVKRALEEAGFALPEPIYRLRFDPTAPPPFEAGQHTAPARPARPVQRRAPMPDNAAGDVAPENSVLDMVEEERRANSGKDKDLLDPASPRE